MRHDGTRTSVVGAWLSAKDESSPFLDLLVAGTQAAES
jgi:hypothetical protein